MTGGIALSAVLPTFNEQRNIVPLLERLDASVAAIAHEIVVVDDDSPDGTAAIAEAYAATHPAVRVVKRVGVRGLRTAIQEGIDRSTGAAVVWMDCDLSMPPEDVPRLYAALADADVAVGSRYVPGGADARTDVPTHRAASRVLNRVAQLLLGTEVTDYTSGFVCARRRVLDELRLAGDYGEYCIDLLHRARRRGFRIVEVPYRNTPRVAGESKTASSPLGLVIRGWPYVVAMVRLRRQWGR